MLLTLAKVGVVLPVSFYAGVYGSGIDFFDRWAFVLFAVGAYRVVTG